jgi:transposase
VDIKGVFIFTLYEGSSMPDNTALKALELKNNDTLNPHPERTIDDLFQEHDFFDARDLLQVKYEMLRRVNVDGWSVSRASDSFGFSRPSFYHAQESYDEHGLAGLIPGKRGPRQAHKLSTDVLTFVHQQLAAEPAMKAPTIALLIEKEFGISVHPRSVERALKRKKKKHPKNQNG